MDGDLRDGLAEVFAFSGHNLPVRDVVAGFGSSFSAERHQSFVSTDERRALLWNDRGVTATYAFPPLIKWYVLALVYAHKMKIYVAATADKTLKIFDTQLRLIESIRHEERTITAMSYDDESGNLLVGGMQGVSMWRLYKDAKHGCHVAERLYRFSDCNEWVTKLCCDFPAGLVLALAGRSVYALSLKSRGVEMLMRDIHDCPLTAASWYARTSFYLTACSAGLVRMWTTKVKVTSTPGEAADSEVLHLLHTFGSLHSRAVTGMAMHPSPGLMITVSLDGTLKVTNLETFSELLVIKTEHPISSLRMVVYAGAHTCVTSQIDGGIRLWQISNFLQFIGTSPSTIRGLVLADNLQVGARERWDADAREMATSKGMSEYQREKVHAYRDARMRQSAIASGETEAAMSKREGVDSLMVMSSDQDVRVLAGRGVFRSRLEARDCVSGLRCVAASAYFNTLVCAYRTDASQFLRVFDTLSPESALLRELQPSIPDMDLIECMELVDAPPLLTATTALQRHTDEPRLDVRGAPVPYFVEEILLLGTSSGTVHLLDTTDSMRVIASTQVQYGPVLQMVYRKRARTLFTLGRDLMTGGHEVKVWTVPEMVHQQTLPLVLRFSCLSISPTLDVVVIGCTDGAIRLFHLRPESRSCVEVQEQSDFISPMAAVTAISVCDSLAVVAVASLDCTVNIFTTDKTHLRSIRLISPSEIVFFYGDSVFVAQRTYLLCVLRKDWDGSGRLAYVRSSVDQWRNAAQTGDMLGGDIKRNVRMAVGEEEAVDAVAEADDASSERDLSELDSCGAVEYLSLHLADARPTKPVAPRSSKSLTPRLKAAPRILAKSPVVRLHPPVIPPPW